LIGTTLKPASEVKAGNPMHVHGRWLAAIGALTVLLGALVGVGPSSSGLRGIAARSSAATPRVFVAAPADPMVSAAADPQPVLDSQDFTAIFVQSGRDTQINTRGFGDIGMQFQNTVVGGPIFNNHISNQGNDNITNSNLGSGNTIINNGSTG
jgi:hypothetical protein